MLKFLIQKLTGKTMILLDEDTFALVIPMDGDKTVAIPQGDGVHVALTPEQTFYLSCTMRCAVEGQEFIEEMLEWIDAYHKRMTGQPASRRERLN